MKRRVRKIANFFAFNLLFFALYLNFIHKDNVTSSSSVSTEQGAQNSPAFSGTVLVENPEKVLGKKVDAAAVTVQQESPAKETNGSALKLSIN